MDYRRIRNLKSGRNSIRSEDIVDVSSDTYSEPTVN